MGITLKTAAGKVLTSLTLVGAAAGVAGLGTYGAFTDSTLAGAKVEAGTVKIDLGAAGTWTSFNLEAGGLVPGDTVQRLATMKNSGSQSLAEVALTTTALTSSKLNTDATRGLQIAVDSCPAGWVEAGKAPGFTYSCPGAITRVQASAPIIGPDRALENLTSLVPGGTDALRFTGTLPAVLEADNTLQGRPAPLDFPSLQPNGWPAISRAPRAAPGPPTTASQITAPRDISASR
ncbi:TasA family protein [Paenarthrobacter sp. PH39-S1]|uniref:TasA family protein n=1 Tax=Paenarthrobacter sp. PH39-S1 TaxID=3046204 RepID=UPI0024B8B56F|nr:TasA family protein [Paenarthrobacter sp. PH39-S1]MDJ0356100.1 TasA family protein [Paenarthrobacter sp. PH39-S1]